MMISINKEFRLGLTTTNNQGCLMKIVEYNNCDNIIVEFQDKHKATVHTKYGHFISGGVKNPYYPNVYGVGATGDKYPTNFNGKKIKEHNTWNGMLTRCFDDKTKEKYPTYKNVVCCKEWLLYDNFYEWVHNQSNLNKWLNGDRWALDKDILIKGNNIYSPETCCLVPQYINNLFAVQNSKRGCLPIGVSKSKNKFLARCYNPITNKRERLGLYLTPEDAFLAYKRYKENLVKQVAQIEFDKDNITSSCYDAMMKYEVEITD